MKYKIAPSKEAPDIGKVIENVKIDPNYLCCIVMDPFSEQAKILLKELIDEYGANSKSYFRYHQIQLKKFQGSGLGITPIPNYIQPYLIGPDSSEVITNRANGVIGGFFFSLDTKEIILTALREMNAQASLSEGFEKTRIPNLDLSSNVIKELCALALGKNNAIRKLNMSGCTFSAPKIVLNAILKNRNLASITLNDINGITPEVIPLLVSHPRLRSISIGSDNDPAWTVQFKDQDLKPILQNHRLVHFAIPSTAPISGGMKNKLETHLMQNAIAMRQLFINQMLAVLISKPNDLFTRLPTDAIKIIFEYVGRDLPLSPNVKTAAINLVCSNARQLLNGKRVWHKTITISDKPHTVFKSWSTSEGLKQAEERYKQALDEEKETIATLNH